MNQSNLFESLPYVAHSETSRDAAESMEMHAETARGRVYRLLCSIKGGLTDTEACERLAMNSSTYRPRRVELVARGLIVESIVRRPTPSGRAAVVWMRKPAAQVQYPD